MPNPFKPTDLPYCEELAEREKLNAKKSWPGRDG